MAARVEIIACGTYLTHLERDFLFHANSFTEGAFVEDDPDEVAARIEAAMQAGPNATSCTPSQSAQQES